ncbi:hypothetical protein T492DRAFT_1017292 [Pavlovales sp. CCMP2436]|nr:hypothetical protein T492DRAFT_1017292 [Pavlovales sp. CCMP2436]
MYSHVESAANTEAAEQLHAKGVLSAESGDLAKAVRLLQKATRLVPANAAFALKHEQLARQLKAVQGEAAREQKERSFGSTDNGWSQAADEPSDSRGAAGAGSEPGASNRDSRGGDGNVDDAVESPPRRFAPRTSFTELWHRCRRKVVSLCSARWLSGTGDWALSLLPRDEERAHRLTYLGYFWLRRLEAPLFIGGICGTLRFCFSYPWLLFYAASLAALPLGYITGRAYDIRRQVLGGVLGLHALFVWACPYSTACIYGAVLWLGLAAFFRTIAFVATGAVLWIYFFPWSTLKLLAFVGWVLFMWTSPISTGVVSTVATAGWYAPLSVLLLASLLLSGMFAFDRSLFAFPILGLGVLTFLRPRVSAGITGVAALGFALKFRAQLLAWWATEETEPDEDRRSNETRREPAPRERAGGGRRASQEELRRSSRESQPHVRPSARGPAGSAGASDGGASAAPPGAGRRKPRK